ncbi:MAG: helix-turn-helix domain-containing protein [Oscillospiraceae bacterium]|nr:helix-turn-helix domain-containing protein [Oscillospiraceae bacterium]
MTINERIRYLRKDQLKLSQTDFASLIGMKQTSVSSFEKNGATVTDQTVRSICLAIDGLNEDWLRTGNGDMFIERSGAVNALDILAKEHQLSTSEKILIEKILNLKPGLRKGIVDFIVDVAEALAAETLGNQIDSPESIDIDTEVEAFRLELEHQKKAAEDLSASDGFNGAKLA